MDEVVRKVLENEHRLEIGRRIGRGGFAEVYEAHSAEGVPYAVKVSLDPVDEANPAVKKELENLRLVQAVTGHPNIVSLMDYWLVGGYLVTRWELATDGSLLDLLGGYQAQGQTGIPVQNLLRYVYEAAKGIDVLDGHGIYHHDIKPANLLLFHGHVKVADLGLAKFAGASTVSHTGSGTLGYLPPEAYDQHKLSKTVDLYSLAATYVKLRTGHEPFGGSPTEIIQRQMGGEPIVDGLDPAEAHSVRQALAAKWVRELYRTLRQGSRTERNEETAPPPARPSVDSERRTQGGQDDNREHISNAIEIGGVIEGSIGKVIRQEKDVPAGSQRAAASEAEEKASLTESAATVRATGPLPGRSSPAPPLRAKAATGRESDGEHQKRPLRFGAPTLAVLLLALAVVAVFGS